MALFSTPRGLVLEGMEDLTDLELIKLIDEHYGRADLKKLVALAIDYIAEDELGGKHRTFQLRPRRFPRLLHFKR